ncbi:MAG TPA: mechanosensitive ion channel family protein [Thermoanaerobaculia bacterium]|nr:mechanosensitive ion channel family protein [Thermoanaerobaculia bacterium]HQR66944.1 mechanosensitive ion channel family protein [Thermoanaerobaculia bacterium]
MPSRRSFFVLFALLSGLATPAASQLPGLLPTATPAPEAPAGDLYRRETPRGTLLGFVSAAQKDNWALAAEYLQVPAGRDPAASQALARQLSKVLDRDFTGDILKLSASPLGDVADGLPQDLERAGQIAAGDETVDVFLVRKTPADGSPIWLISAQTLREIPRLYREAGVPEIEEKLPEVLRRHLGPLQVWQLLGFLGLLPVIYLFARLGLSIAVRPLRTRLDRGGRQGDLREALKSARTPTAVLVTLLLHRLAVPYLGLSLLFRYRYGIWFTVSVVTVSAWLLLRLVDAFSGTAGNRFAEAGVSAVPTLTLARRILKGAVLLVAVLTGLSALGVNLTAALAGLGIGGVAVAFAARTSIENIFGGFTILGDKIVRVGDTCRIGTYTGTIEDITLFATRLRTPERTVVSIPNGTMLTREIENLSRRDRFLLTHVVGLRYETTPAQMRAVLAALRKLLADHPRVAPEDARVRLLRLGASSLDLELRAYVLAPDWAVFLEVQEELLLAVVDAVARCGTGVAFPSQTIYVGKDVPPAPSVPA